MPGSGALDEDDDREGRLKLPPQAARPIVSAEANPSLATALAHREQTMVFP